MSTKELGASLVQALSHYATVSRILPLKVEVCRAVAPVYIAHCALRAATWRKRGHLDYGVVHF